ncbi:hypothetical protein OTK55_06425 [Methanosphaera sp. Vir-13MRS]|uniref:hypothetical protein n=1 Tax=Candidatus Methanosphaera massiliense TaxID=3017187 RepID=UPI002380AF3D|nr:hypothetical protein [Candidatus Methanosphaera massiliense]MDE4078650.1 hypothetical protein [Candidatus Methanosphaera massiliense]
MNKRLTITLTLFLIILSSTVVSAGLFDGIDSSSDVKTHEFNYANKAVFNLNDELTDKTGVETILFGEGVSYEYPAKEGKEHGLVNMLGGLVSSGSSDWVESKQNTAYIEEIESNPTFQGYETHIFKYDNMEEYEVYIDLNNMTIVKPDGFEEQYDYFSGTFQSLDEAKIFIQTFKINEDVIG